MMNKPLIKYYLFLIAILFGFVITVQFKTSGTHQGIVTIPKLLEMQNEIANLEKEVKQLEIASQEAIRKYTEYKESIETTGSIVKTMESELVKTRLYSDYAKVEGPGVIITMNDSDWKLQEGESSDWYVIHDIDVLEVVNELKIAGAEAISINDERITANSRIRCGGPIIIIDGKRHAVPFIIKAIGDPKTLEATMLAQDSYVDLMELSGIRVETTKVERIVMEGYDVRPDMRYIKKAEGGEAN